MSSYLEMANETAYRAQTARQAPCAGMTAPTFACRRCGQRKRVRKGCTRNAAGWMCVECAGGQK